MAKGISFPLTIKGLREAKEDFAKLKKEIKETSDIKLSQKLAKDINKLDKEIEQATDSLLDMNKAGQLAGTRFDDLNEVLFNTKEEVLPLTSQIGDMEDRMYQLAASGEANSEEFKVLQKETSRLRRVIIETDKSVDLLAENSGLGVFAEGWASIGGSIARLDFKGAEKGAMRLEGAMGNMTTIAKGGMKSLSKTVGILGKSFVKFGVTLLTNPLFWLVTIIGGLVTALVVVANKLGILGDIFDFLAAPVKAIIQAFKDLTDWLGLTSFATNELAEAEKKQAEARIEQIKKENAQIDANKAKRDKVLNDALKGFDLEIRKAKLAGKSDEEIRKIEKKARDRKIKGLKEDKKDAEEKLKLKLDDLKSQAKKFLAEAKQAEANSDKQKALLKRAQFRLDAAEKQKVIIRKGSAVTIAEINKQISEVEIGYLEKTSEEDKAKVEERRAKYKEYAANRLDATRQIQDLELELMAEGIEKEVAILNTKFDREIEDTLSSETLKQAEKEKIVKYYESLRAAEEGRLRLEKRTKEEEAKKAAEAADKFKQDAETNALAQIEQFQEAAFQLTLTEEERERQALEYKYTNQKALAEQFGQDLTAIKAAQLIEEEKLDKKYADKSKALKQAEIDAKANTAISGLQLVASVTELFAHKSEKAARLAFNIQKAASIAQATMDGYKAVLSAYAGTAGGPVIKGIAAGIAGGFSAVQIAKIASSKFEGGGGSVSTAAPSSGSVGGGGSTASAPSTPSFELFGQPNQFNNVEGADSAEQTITVNAVVSETEVTQTQNTISNIQQNAEL